VSDVPVGVFLSGGIDSSTNAALFSEGEDRPVRTFSIGYEGEYDTYRNEFHYARLMAERIGAEHHERALTQDDLISFLPKMVHLQDEPIADPVCVPVYYVSKLARDNGVIVAQVGEGADELFWGYPAWKTYRNLARWNDAPVPRIAKEPALRSPRPRGQRDTARGSSSSGVRRSASRVLERRGAFTQAEKQRLLAAVEGASLDGLTSGGDPAAARTLGARPLGGVRTCRGCHSPTSTSASPSCS
jgi:asparagine synthase (glutamine-hydrolysing)